MKLNQLSDNPGAHRPRKRVGRGIGSGLGKTSGHGQKGQKSRSGVAINGYEGGQMPIHRRLPKRGFTNYPFRVTYDVVNLGRLQKAVEAGKLKAGADVDADALVAAGLLRRKRNPVRLLAKGELSAKLTIHAAAASKAAIEAVEKAGGSVVLSPVKPAAPEAE
ncbi:MAG: 50S ribosomal protein L15 [Alphaproteobacteria bacterium]